MMAVKYSIFGTKAETLERIRALGLTVDIPLFQYIDVKQWQSNPSAALDSLDSRLRVGVVAVRSSAASEDGSAVSLAGAFESYLNIDANNESELCGAIERVFASYPDAEDGNQVLIQQMVEHIAVSGVILTHCLDDGSPYYVLSYDDETGTSDSITSGRGGHKTVMVYRGYKKAYCDSPRILQMMMLAEELETHLGDIPLDIEFALDSAGKMHLLQVRRITTVRGWHPDCEHRVRRIIPHIESFVTALSAPRSGLYGDYTILGNMPDWNPAEIIGVVPLPLAVSLYRRLITTYVWSDARLAMGYRNMPRTELMTMIGGHPYIDVRASFNSFIPSGLPQQIGEKLVGGWLARLEEQPSLHDKVEFDVAHTALDFSFDESFAERYGDLLNATEQGIYKEILRKLTAAALDLSPGGTLQMALGQIDQLARRESQSRLEISTNSPVALGAHIGALLSACARNGTLPFAIIARHAFIAEAILRSAIYRNALSSDRVAEFKSSFRTVMGELVNDTLAVSRGELSEELFFERYGHLRPGTYDILSPCYRQRIDLFTDCRCFADVPTTKVFELSSSERKNVSQLLVEAGLDIIDADGFLQYAQRAIQGREYAKFVFTKYLSATLEAIADWGAYYNLGREDLAHLAIDDILDRSYSSSQAEVTSVLMGIVDRARIEHSLAKVVKLSYLIRGVRDIHIAPIHRSQPNYITQRTVEGQIVWLQAAALDCGALDDKIVCIENADPGFDWIFTKGIAGLITKYGGTNSHMAIRCAELKLPAAIGCGEQLFERMRNWRKLHLDCSAKTLRSGDAYG